MNCKVPVMELPTDKEPGAAEPILPKNAAPAAWLSVRAPRPSTFPETVSPPARLTVRLVLVAPLAESIPKRLALEVP